MPGYGGKDPELTFLRTFGIPADAVGTRAVLSPGWLPERLFPDASIRELTQSSPLFGYRVWQIQQEGIDFCWIRTGFGAPVVLDAVLLLGLTSCREIVFVSSAGSLSEDARIGDLLLPEYAVNGTGAIRYLYENADRDYYGEVYRPDNGLYLRIKGAAEDVQVRSAVGLHIGHPFCTDTIAAQRTAFEYIRTTGADSVDMESAAAFCAAKAVGISAAAILQVGDLLTKHQALFDGRGDSSDMEYRRTVQRNILPLILLKALNC